MIVEEYWSRFSETYDVNQETVAGKELLDAIAEELRSLPALDTLVELGCGTGYFTQTIVERSAWTIATDLSESLLEAAERRLSGTQSVSFQRENCMKTSFAEEEFDTVFMANLIHVVADPVSLIRECHRILKPRGRIVVVTFTSHGMSLWEKVRMGVRFIKTWGKPPAHTHVFSPEGMAVLLEDAGFVVGEMKLIGERTKALFLVARKG